MAVLVLGGPWHALGVILLALAASCGGEDPSGPGSPDLPMSSRIIDHNCCDLWAIPMSRIEEVQNEIRLHYAHTSHGSQLITGLERIEEADEGYDVEIGHSFLPEQAGALCIFDGQAWETYIDPALFWQTPEGMDRTRDVLDGNPSIKVCMWSWCSQLDGFSQEGTQAYLDAMSELESEYPEVTFVYMTGNAQASGGEGCNRFQRNELIRGHCRTGGRMLYDFADLDCWWYDPSAEEWEQSTYRYEGIDVPIEHPEFNGDRAGHTTFESCEQKGRALWWLLAVTAGWTGE